MVDDLLAEADRVIAFWSLSGIQAAALWGLRPTGRRISGSTISILRFRDGRLVEYDSRANRLRFLLRLGSAGDYAGQLALETV